MTPVIFDLDGTLIDSAPDIHAAVNALLRELGKPTLELPKVISFIGNGVGVLMERVIDASGLDMADHPALVEHLMVHYTHSHAGLTTLYPGLEGALKTLHDRGTPMAICTNKPEAPAHHILDALGIAHMFGAVVGGDTCASRKPNPEMLHHTLNLIGGEVCIYVGDSEVDADTAQAAEVPFLLFTEGYRKTPVDQIPHTHSFSSYDDFLTLLPG